MTFERVPVPPDSPKACPWCGGPHVLAALFIGELPYPAPEEDCPQDTE